MPSDCDFSAQCAHLFCVAATERASRGHFSLVARRDDFWAIWANFVRFRAFGGSNFEIAGQRATCRATRKPQTHDQSFGRVVLPHDWPTRHWSDTRRPVIYMPTRLDTLWAACLLRSRLCEKPANVQISASLLALGSCSALPRISLSLSLWFARFLAARVARFRLASAAQLERRQAPIGLANSIEASAI